MTFIDNIDLETLAPELRQHVGQWVAVSAGNRIVASGSTYAETAAQVGGRTDVVLLRVPPLDASLAPSAG